MTPSLTWLDLTATDRDRMRRVLDLFTEQGTIDELGLGTLRDTLSDALFPGTSSIQTRLRYVLFVPWLYQKLERDRAKAGDIAEAARRAELALIAPLIANTDNDGVIGGRARGALKRLPSMVYWSALIRWGLFAHDQSQGWYHARFDRFTRRRPVDPTADDPGVVWTATPAWNRRLPEPPDGFPNIVSFALTRNEAVFLRDQLAGRCHDSLLAWLAAEGVAPTGSFWDDPAALQAPDRLRGTVDLARRFSLHVEGAPLLYNLMLAELRAARTDDPKNKEMIESYRAELARWHAQEQAEAPFDAAALWHFVAERGGRLSTPQCRFVQAWGDRVAATDAATVADDAALRDLVRAREMRLKTSRSRFTNDSRLLDWSGSAGVGRMDFRWFRVKQLLTDLHRGLEA